MVGVAGSSLHAYWFVSLLCSLGGSRARLGTLRHAKPGRLDTSFLILSYGSDYKLRADSMKDRTTIWFWLCCGGTLIFAVICQLTAWFESLAGLTLITLPYPIGLCFASANCVRSHPHLAKLGMYTLILLILVISDFALIDYFKWRRT